MYDRVSEKPGRVLITPEDGSTPFYATVTMADEPTQDGTPPTKANLLTDETAALFGLGNDATVNDALKATDDRYVVRPKETTDTYAEETIPFLSEDRKKVIDSGVKGKNLPKVMRDGVTLSFLPSINLPSSVGSPSIATGKGKIVVVGGSSSSVLPEAFISTDGETWEAVTLPFTVSALYKAKVAYDEKLDMFVVIKGSDSTSFYSNEAAYSKDGVNWTAIALPTSGVYTALAAGNGRFVIGAYRGGYAFYSTDGVTWEKSSNWCVSYSANVACNDISYDEKSGVFVAVANLDSDTPGTNIKYSADGDTWVECGSIEERPKHIACGNGIYVALSGGDTAHIGDASFQDTTTTLAKTTLPTLTTGSYNELVYANGMFFAISDDVAEMAVSTDGLTWEKVSTPIISGYGGVYNGDKFVFIGNQAGVIDSYDGIHWHVRNQYRFRLPNGDDVTDTIKAMLGI